MLKFVYKCAANCFMSRVKLFVGLREIPVWWVICSLTPVLIGGECEAIRFSLYLLAKSPLSSLAFACEVEWKPRRSSLDMWRERVLDPDGDWHSGQWPPFYCRFLYLTVYRQKNVGWYCLVSWRWTQHVPPKCCCLPHTARALHHHRKSLKCQDGMMIEGQWPTQEFCWGGGSTNKV
jgi:hypothetical protein